MLEAVKETAHYIQEKTNAKPTYGIILGTGLGALIDEVEVTHTLPYSEIPHFPQSTVQSHQGQLVFGKLGDKEIVAMQGRFHYYEGYSMQELTFPVRVLRWLGIEGLFLSNACGSVNPDMKTGDMMILEDHINLLPDSPLRGKHYEEFGDMFPDMSEPYKKAWINKALELADQHAIPVKKGVYASIQGPNLETRAEYRWIRTIGADTIGMSTIPEVLVARQMHLPCFAVSAITDEGFHDELEVVTIEKVIAAANAIEPKMTKLMKELIKEL